MIDKSFCLFLKLKNVLLLQSHAAYFSWPEIVWLLSNWAFLKKKAVDFPRVLVKKKFIFLNIASENEDHERIYLVAP